VNYARFKPDDKKIKKSLKTHDRKKADRELAALIQKIENKTQEKPDLVLEALADEWLASVKPRMKESSYTRCRTSTTGSWMARVATLLAPRMLSV
jgi:hypothetical protein